MTMHDVAKERELDLIAARKQLNRALRSIRIWRRRALVEAGINYLPLRENNWDYSSIDDGFGNVWSIVCPDCGGDMEIVRPGQVQCKRECWRER